MALSVAESETLKGPLDDLRAFCRVMELGSLSAAARVLNETKGSISRRISRLEKTLGVQLLARTPRAVKPTEAGEQFFISARKSLAVLDDAVNHLRDTDIQPSGHLRITAPIDLGTEMMPALLAAFRREYPAITVELELSNARLDLSAHQIDIAIRAAGNDLPDMGYSAMRLIPLPIGFYAAPEYLARHAPLLQPQDLFQADLILPPKYHYQQHLVLTQNHGQKEVMDVKGAFLVNDFACAHRLVLARCGVGILPEIIAAPSVAAGALVQVLPEWLTERGYLYAITLNSLRSPTKLVVFKSFLKSWLAQGRYS